MRLNDFVCRTKHLYKFSVRQRAGGSNLTDFHIQDLIKLYYLLLFFSIRAQRRATSFSPPEIIFFRYKPQALCNNLWPTHLGKSKTKCFPANLFAFKLIYFFFSRIIYNVLFLISSLVSVVKKILLLLLSKPKKYENEPKQKNPRLNEMKHTEILHNSKYEIILLVIPASNTSKRVEM